MEITIPGQILDELFWLDRNVNIPEFLDPFSEEVSQRKLVDWIDWLEDNDAQAS